MQDPTIFKPFVMTPEEREASMKSYLEYRKGVHDGAIIPGRQPNATGSGHYDQSLRVESEHRTREFWDGYNSQRNERF